MKTKTRMVASAKKLEKAEQALKESKLAHRAAFRVALVKLFNEYRFYLDANGTEGARLDIEEFGPSQKEYALKELPE